MILTASVVYLQHARATLPSYLLFSHKSYRILRI